MKEKYPWNIIRVGVEIHRGSKSFEVDYCRAIRIRKKTDVNFKFYTHSKIAYYRKFLTLLVEQLLYLAQFIDRNKKCEIFIQVYLVA